MTIGTAFGILGISPTDDIDSIQHAFAQRSRNAHPEENPEGWRELSQAYQVCMAYAKRKNSTGTDTSEIPGLQEYADFVKKQREKVDQQDSDDDGKAEPEETDYYDLYQGLLQKQEDVKQVEQQLDELLDQLEGEKVINTLSGYRLALEYLSKLVPFAPYDPMPHMVCKAFHSTLKKKKILFLYRERMRRLLSRHSDTLTLADETMMSQGYEETFAGFRTALSTYVFPALLWYFLLFTWVVRFVLTPLYAITQPIRLQVSDGPLHYVSYSNDLPEGSYVKTTLKEAHWVGMGYNHGSDTVRSGKIRMTTDSYRQYLFLQAKTTDGENVLISFKATFNFTNNRPDYDKQQEGPDFFSSCTKLAKDINQSGNYPLIGIIQCLNYNDPLQPGIPPSMAIDFLIEANVDEELQKLLPDNFGLSLHPEQDTKESQEQSAVSSSDNQLFTPETKGLFILEDPPKEGTSLSHEERIYYRDDPKLFLQHKGIGLIIYLAFFGAAMLALLIALKKGKIPHVVVG